MFGTRTHRRKLLGFTLVTLALAGLLTRSRSAAGAPSELSPRLPSPATAVQRGHSPILIQRIGETRFAPPSLAIQLFGNEPEPLLFVLQALTPETFSRTPASSGLSEPVCGLQLSIPWGALNPEALWPPVKLRQTGGAAWPGGRPTF